MNAAKLADLIMELFWYDNAFDYIDVQREVYRVNSVIVTKEGAIELLDHMRRSAMLEVSGSNPAPYRLTYRVRK